MVEKSMDMVSITIDDRKTEVKKGVSILDAARAMGIVIPTLCHSKGLESYGACRVCLVELDGPAGAKLVASCKHPVDSDIVVRTDTELVRESRKTVVELLLSQAPESDELKEFAAGLGVTSTPFEEDIEGKCILCGLCVRACNDLMNRGVISFFGRGAKRKVDTAFSEKSDLCQVCGACSFVCPTGAIDLNLITSKKPQPHITGHDEGLTARPCIDLAHPQAAPRVPYIDRDSCAHFRTDDCGLCAEACQADAIEYDQKEEAVELEVGAVIMTPGFDTFDAKEKGEYGFGFSPNVITNVQFERLLSAAGPTGGKILRPSDNQPPKKLAFIQCVGSRDAKCNRDYCSSVCCMAAVKESILAREHDKNIEVTVFFLDLRAFGKDFDRYLDRAKNKLGVRFLRSFISRTFELPESRNLRLVHMNDEMKKEEEDFDMVVLSTGIKPGASLKELANSIGFDLNRWGFAQTRELAPLDSSRPGVYVGGAFQEPKDIPDTVMQASAAASRAMSLLSSARGTKVSSKAYPPEKDITDEPPRIGVFVCHCGSNISSVVDVNKVVERTRKLPYVAFAEHNVYTCADDSQDQIKDKIKELGLNRVVIASCTPRTHESIFRDTMRDAGLNPYLLEMANIRDQCSWVHPSNPSAATEKACDLVKMSAGRCANLSPLAEETIDVVQSALVVGGGIAGMTAALSMAEQGFEVDVVEKEEELGGLALMVHRTLDGADVSAFIEETKKKITNNPLITVHTGSKVTAIKGHVGNFASTCESSGNKIEINHGVMVVATGAKEHKPDSFGYNDSDKVITQLELSDLLGKSQLLLPNRSQVVMIQCVEQRNEAKPYCSRVCCATAVKNALFIKEKYPDAKVMVLYRDIRTYGFKESYYKQAREKGVLFVRYDESDPPKVNASDKLEVKAKEISLGKEMVIEPDLVVLATPANPCADREELSELLRVPLNADGFFLEAHMKLRPVDFASEGLFLCGTAHAPKFISETISQAAAVAGRAAGILSKAKMSVGGQTAWVDPDKCVSCMTCVHICPYMAPVLGQNNKATVQSAVCMGCGSCASECPAKAIKLRHFMDVQILGAIESLLGKDAEDNADEAPLFGQVGISHLRWGEKKG